MPLALLGTGLVSPLGRSPREHAFFTRAGVAPATPGGFVDAEGTTVNAAYCPWLGAELPVVERLVALASSALRDATTSFLARPHPSRAAPRVALFVCTAAPWEGLTEAARNAVDAALPALVGARAATRATGTAGFFRAISEAALLLEKGEAEAAALVAVDTMICPAALHHLAEGAMHPWVASPPRPAEAAAAVLVTTEETARTLDLPPLGRIVHHAAASGGGSDLDDEIVDGTAMTTLLRTIPSSFGIIGAAFGQQGVDPLRTREWHLATARNAARFHREALFDCLEARIGLLGAAAGAANLVYGAAMRRHRTWERPSAAEGLLVAWAISRDGLRGLCAMDRP